MLLSLIVLTPEYHLPKNYQFQLAYNIYEIIIYSCIIQCDNGRNRPLYGAFGNGIPQRRFLSIQLQKILTRHISSTDCSRVSKARLQYLSSQNCTHSCLPKVNGL